jgi:hypothetical protein
MNQIASRSSIRWRSVRRGALIRAVGLTLFVATTAIAITAATPGVAGASQTSWSAPVDVDATTPIYAVSCASPSFCVAVDQDGNALVYNGSTMSAPTSIDDAALYSVSCPTATFCAAVDDNGNAIVYNGSSWSAPTAIDHEEEGPGVLNSVSCPTASFCVAVDDDGNAFTYDGSSWSSAANVDETGLYAVSCPTVSFCVAVDQTGNAFTYDGSSWTSGDDIDGYDTLESVSCSSPTFCVAVDDFGNALTYDGSSWSSALDIDGSETLFAVSCTTASFCMASDAAGNALTYDGSTWSSDDVDGTNPLFSVSCPTTSFCAAVDGDGNALTYGWVSADYSCNVPGFGTTTDPVVVSETPSPPSSITAPGTFQTTLSADFTVPANVLNAAVSDGVTSVTLDSVSFTVNGLTPDDDPSNSVTPNSLSASATNLPITFTPQTNTPFTFATTYNPETWQTASNPGTVNFTPGQIVVDYTYVVSGSPNAESADCSPPSGIAALDSTVVNATSPTPSFEAPASVPPLQAEVTAPLADGWAIAVTNTSMVPVDGLSAQVTVGDGGAPLTYDLAGMAKAGTSCSSSGSGTATCNVGALGPGDTRTINALVDTTGLAEGTSITGTVDVTSSNAGSQSSSLGAVSVVVVENGAVAVAVPKVAVTSTTAPLSDSVPSKVTLKLPRKVPVMSGPFEGAAGHENGPASAKGPPVAVTLEPLASSQDPEMCPASSGGCDGDIVEIGGDFSAYTSTAKPISAVVKIFYGVTVPAASMYFQDSPNDGPQELTACLKTAGQYNTPCVKGKEKIIGSRGNLSTQDTIYFTGGDPLVGRK